MSFIGPTQVELEWEQKADYSISTPRATFLREADRFLELTDPDAIDPAYAGNRPKLFEDGEAVGDFGVVREDVHVHLLGIESPGLTAAPALGRLVRDMVSELI